MKKLLLFVLLIAGVATGSFAQIENPVSWTYSAKKTGDKTVNVYVTATIAPGWHLYAQDAGEGPIPTAINFVNNPLVKADEKLKEEGKLQKEFDPNFNSVLKFYSNKVSFVQKFKLKSTANTVVKGSVTYMVCNDKKCLPPKTVPFSVKVSGK